MIFLRIVFDSFNQAIQQLTSNKLRSFLTLLGITIGIFCVIAVLSSVDSLEENIIQSFDKFGNDVIYVDKWPWAEDPGQNFYKYMGRPTADVNDLRNVQIKSKLSQAASLAVFLPGRTTKFMDVVVEGAYMAGITEDYDKIIKLDFEDGNYFSARDFQIGSNQAILGNKLAVSLFPKGNGVGKEIKIGGQKFQVVGILKNEGKSIISIMPNDEAVFIPYNTARKLVSINSSSNWGTLLSIKANKGVDLEELKYEVSSIIRPGRGLKPREKDNFSINRITMLTNLVDKVFGVINFAGFIIGLFSMLVGAFGVANIMFVSVKERTNLIGIKMAIGAKRYFILLEYLIEAIILCIIGGLVGLFIVWGVLFVVAKVLDFPIYMSFQNIALGIGLSILIGIVAGIIPAIIASRMDPVEAIRK